MHYRLSPRDIQKRRRISFLERTEHQIAIPKDRLIAFEKSICGQIIYPWSDSYDQDRKDFNNVYPAFPIMIIYVTCYTDITYSINLAKEFDIQVAIRSGGHSLADYSVCDGIVIDMSNIKSVYVDSSTDTAWVEAGCTFEEFVPKIEQFGYHVPTGGCPTVAVAGFMMGGGYSLTSRLYGMNCDSVIEVTVLLADGRVVIANESQNQDLFWAIRGGTGGNFGVLISVKYKLYRLGNIWGIKMTWDIDPDPTNAAKALYTLQQAYLVPTGPTLLGLEVVLSADDAGNKKVFFCACFNGSEAAFDQALQPMYNIPGHTITAKPYGKYSHVNKQVLEGTPDLPENIKAYSRSAYIADPLSESDWLNVLNFFKSNAPNKYTMIDMECYGGAINSEPVGSNAFIHRNVLMDFFCDAFFNEETCDQQRNEEFISELFDFMAQYSNGHSYQNYPNRSQTDFRWAYWGNYYNQLVLIKQKYDPENFFHYQQSIGPVPSERLEGSKILFHENQIIYEDFS